jgi:hypothetical protein
MRTTSRSKNKPAKTGPKQDGRFVKGASGNPSGRPEGSLNHASVVLEAMLDGEVESIGRKVIDAPLAGDSLALKLCIVRLLPAKRERRLKFDFELPDTRDAAGVSAALSALIKATADGRLEVSQAETLARILEGQRRILEAEQLEQRIQALEAKANEQANDK